MNKVYQIREYGSFICDKEAVGYVTLPKRTFEQLENFILSNRSDDADAAELMGISARKGLGRAAAQGLRRREGALAPAVPGH